MHWRHLSFASLIAVGCSSVHDQAALMGRLAAMGDRSLAAERAVFREYRSVLARLTSDRLSPREVFGPDLLVGSVAAVRGDRLAIELGPSAASPEIGSVVWGEGGKAGVLVVGVEGHFILGQVGVSSGLVHAGDRVGTSL